jgi:Fe-S-cluster containining protein
MGDRLSSSTIRKMALELHVSVDWRHHPCHRGNGSCCDPAPYLTPHDIAIIQQGIRRKEISQNIISAARKRVGGSACGFLDENRRCTIYDHRPVVCIATGTAGALSESYKDESEKAIRQYLDNGIDVGIPVAHTVTTMCADCHECLARRDVRFHVPNVLAYEEIVMFYLLNARTPINKAISNFRL